MRPLVYKDQYDVEANVGTICTAEEGKTRQSDAQAADINLTIKKYNLQPMDMVPGWSGEMGQFGDVSELPSYQEMLNRVAIGRESFMQLPPDVRVLFGNEPAVMLDAWNEGRMAEVFERIGWLERKPVEEPAVEPPKPA